MSKVRVGLVTAWGECGMGYLARNWVYTFENLAVRLIIKFIHVHCLG